MSTLLILGLILSYAPYDRIVAVVGKSPILESDVQEIVKVLKLQPLNLTDSLLYEKALDGLIANKLLLNQAERETVEVSPKEVEEELNNAISSMKQRFESEEEFDKALKQEGLTLELLKDRYRSQVENRLIVQRLLAKRGLTDIYISPARVKEFYKENKDSIAVVPGRIKLAHILFLIKPSKSEERRAQQRIAEVYDILLRGGDFEIVAKSFSEDPLTKYKGGYLGKIERGTMIKEIEDILFSLKEGEFSKPFRSKLGYQIVKCERKGEGYIIARHILIKVPVSKGDTLRTKRLALKVREKILKGEDFSKLCKKYSEDPSTKDNGGLIGELPIEALPPSFKSVAGLDSGQVSLPLLSEYGFHLVKVLEKHPERILSYEEMRDDIRNYLYNQELEKRVEELVKDIRKHTYVERFK